MGVDWKNLLDGNFVKIENGVAKIVVVSNWRPQESFKGEDGEIKPGVVFDVLEEDGTDYRNREEGPKTWTVTAIKALAKIRPICETAEQLGKNEIKIRVLRAGEGKKTVYEIKEV